eukprot:1143701-Pelagomonas_calceolata.AAC.3
MAFYTGVLYITTVQCNELNAADIHSSCDTQTGVKCAHPPALGHLSALTPLLQCNPHVTKEYLMPSTAQRQTPCTAPSITSVPHVLLTCATHMLPRGAPHATHSAEHHAGLQVTSVGWNQQTRYIKHTQPDPMHWPLAYLLEFLLTHNSLTHSLATTTVCTSFSTPSKH